MFLETNILNRKERGTSSHYQNSGFPCLTILMKPIKKYKVHIVTACIVMILVSTLVGSLAFAGNKNTQDDESTSMIIGEEEFEEIRSEMNFWERNLITPIINITMAAQTMLELKSMEELIFGWKYVSDEDSAFNFTGEYIGGTLKTEVFDEVGGMYTKTEWDNVIQRFFGVFQSLAFCLITISIIFTGFAIAKNSDNPQGRTIAKEKVTRIGITVLLFVIILPLILIVMDINKQLVIGIAQLRPESSMTMQDTIITWMTKRTTNWTASLVVSLFVVYYTLYFNVIYLLRKFMIGALIIVAPLVIWAWSRDHQQSFYLWLSEMTSNIFMQSAHALVFMLYLHMVSVTDNLFAQIVMLLFLVPVGMLLRQLISGWFGLLGVDEEQTAGRIAGGMLGTIAATAGIVGGAAKGALDGIMANLNRNKPTETPAGTSGGEGGGNAQQEGVRGFGEVQGAYVPTRPANPAPQTQSGGETRAMDIQQPAAGGESGESAYEVPPSTAETAESQVVPPSTAETAEDQATATPKPPVRKRVAGIAGGAVLGASRGAIAHGINAALIAGTSPVLAATGMSAPGLEGALQSNIAKIKGRDFGTDLGPALDRIPSMNKTKNASSDIDNPDGYDRHWFENLQPGESASEINATVQSVYPEKNYSVLKTHDNQQVIAFHDKFGDLEKGDTVNNITVKKTGMGLTLESIGEAPTTI